MLVHLLHGIIVVAIVLSFPLGMAALVVLCDDGGKLHRAH